MSSGGKRTGSGAPLKYGEPTKKIQVVIPVSKIAEIKKRIKTEILFDYIKIKS